MKLFTKAFFTLTISSLLVTGAMAQDLEWDKCFGGYSEDVGRAVQQTSDEGYIVAGYTFSTGAGAADVWLIKTDAGGNKQWDKTFGGVESDWATSVQQTLDGGYIISGVTYSFGAGEHDAWLIKTDALGNKQWDKTFGGSLSDFGHSVQQTLDGGYIMAGMLDHDFWYGIGGDFWLIKTDASGNKVWDKMFGGYNWDEAFSVQQTVEGGYVIAGTTGSFGAGSYDAWLIKTDANGNEIWNRTFGGSGWDDAYCVRQTADGGFIIAGNMWPVGMSVDFWLIKTDADGHEQWQRTFGGTEFDKAYSLELAADGGYIMGGFTWSYGAGTIDLWLVKTDASGLKEWDQTFGAAAFDYGYDVGTTSDGGYIVTGFTESYGAGLADVWLLKVSSDLTRISLISPDNLAVLTAPPNFEWAAYGGISNAFAVDLSFLSDFTSFYSTYEHLHQIIYGDTWTMPPGIWNRIPTGTPIYWRVRGVDLDHDPLTVITSDEVWSFNKE